MTTEYGVTATGFVIKPLEAIKAELEADERAQIAIGLNQAAHTVLGQLNGIFSAKIREVWELAEAVYNSNNPDAAEAYSLEKLGALCPGINKLAATKSTVTAVVNLSAYTTLTAGAVASVDGNPSARFVTIEDVVNDTSVEGTFLASMEAEETGPVVANAYTLTVRETVITGWNSIGNLDDAVIGTDVESDRDFRLRREVEIRKPGSTHVEAIKTDILELNSLITTCIVTENDTDITDGNESPHSIHVTLWDNELVENSLIAETIFESKAGGINTVGDVSVSVKDSMGFTHTIRFDRATYTEAAATIGAESFENVLADDAPSDWRDQLIEALMNGRDIDGDGVIDIPGFNSVAIGEDVIIRKLLAILMSFEWIVDIPWFVIGWLGEAQYSTNLSVTAGQLAHLSSENITIYPEE